MLEYKEARLIQIVLDGISNILKAGDQYDGEQRGVDERMFQLMQRTRASDGSRRLEVLS
jgi:hypothetical protein